MSDMAALKDGLLASSGAVFDSDEAERRRKMLLADVQVRTAEAVRRETEAWSAVESVADWEAFRDRRIAALRDSLGELPPMPDDFRAEVTGEIAGDGYRIHKLIFETRPGILVTAHLYLPDPPREAMPGIQVVHAHHRPKEQGELQDMGANWARTGCAVLVPDLFGHGERREDPFGARQGYYSRYYTSMQLRLVGECLIGWMVWDLMRGVDVLLDVPGIDRERILMIGAVAGGGDPTAVTVALDPRVTCSVPFNFGSGAAWRDDLGTPTPEGRNLADWAYWETTRNLYLNTRDEFFPWLIVAAAAPRPLISAHEFAWDKDNNPAWHRMQKVYELYGASEHLGWMKGEGRCAPGAGNTHCTNVGPIHRAGLYPYFEEWFGMEAPEPEIQERREEAELACLTEAVAPRKRLLREVTAEMAAERLAALRAELNALLPPARRLSLRERWARVLGNVNPSSAPAADVRGRSDLDGAVAERIVLEAEPGIVVPTRLFLPAGPDGPRPVVVGVAQQGKTAFLHERGDEIAGLLEAGVAVCLPDVRGTGETQPGRMHGCESHLIDISEQELMLGRTLMGLQLRDLRSTLAYLRTRPELDASRLALWGDSFAPLNPADLVPPEHNSKVVDDPEGPGGPHGLAIAEPLGQLLAMLGALFEDDVKAVLARRGLVGFASLYSSYFFYVPSDCVPPDTLAAGEICDLAAALAPAPLRLEGLVDALDRAVSEEELAEWFTVTTDAYADTPAQLILAADVRPDAAPWLAGALE